MSRKADSRKSTHGGGGGGYFAKEDDDKKLKEVEDKIMKRVSGLEAVLKDNIAQEVNQLKELTASTGQKCKDDAIEKSSQDLAKEISTLRQELDSRMLETSDRIASVDVLAKAAAVEQDMVKRLDSARSKMEEIDANLRETIASAQQEAIARAEQNAKGEIARQGQESEQKVEELRQEMRGIRPSIEARCDTMMGNIKDLQSELSDCMERAEKTVQELESNVKATQKQLEDSLAECLQVAERNAARTATEVEELRSLVKSNEHSLRNAALLAENVHCRTMTWRCGHFHKRLADVVKSESSHDHPGIRSPDFSVCSLPEMQVEIGLAARTIAGDEASSPPKPPLPGTAAAYPTAPLPVPGSCLFRLWGPPGLQAIFRVTMGDGPSAVSRRFEHTFFSLPEESVSEGGDNRTCFEVLNFCQLDQVWVRTEDTLEVHFELLEFKMMPVQCDWGASSQAELEAAAAAQAEDEEISDVRTLLEGWPPAPRGGNPDLMLFTRSATTEMVLQERLQRDMMVLKNKMVRRVEWRVEGCSRLLELCKIGEGVDSPIFSAAGQDRLQFHFYPRGHEVSGTGGTQPCGLFLSGPGRGVTLRGMMWVGINNRSFEHRFQRRGDLGGRPRFCPLESQLDCQDSVTIAFDITEVEQELPDHNQAVVLREARHSTMESSHNSSKLSAATSMTAPAHTGIKGLIKMKREDPVKTEEVVKVVSLPTLNARTMSQMSINMAKSRRSYDF